MTEPERAKQETDVTLKRLQPSWVPRIVGLLLVGVAAALAWAYGRNANIEVVVSVGDEARIASELAAYREGADPVPRENDDRSTLWLVGHTGVVGVFADPDDAVDRVTANMCVFLTRSGPHSSVDCFEQSNGWRRSTRSSWRSSAVRTSEYFVH